MKVKIPKNCKDNENSTIMKQVVVLIVVDIDLVAGCRAFSSCAGRKFLSVPALGNNQKIYLVQHAIAANRVSIVSCCEEFLTCTRG